MEEMAVMTISRATRTTMALTSFCQTVPVSVFLVSFASSLRSNHNISVPRRPPYLVSPPPSFCRASSECRQQTNSNSSFSSILLPSASCISVNSGCSSSTAARFWCSCSDSTNISSTNISSTTVSSSTSNITSSSNMHANTVIVAARVRYDRLVAADTIADRPTIRTAAATTTVIPSAAADTPIAAAARIRSRAPPTLTQPKPKYTGPTIELTCCLGPVSDFESGAAAALPSTPSPYASSSSSSSSIHDTVVSTDAGTVVGTEASPPSPSSQLSATRRVISFPNRKRLKIPSANKTIVVFKHESTFYAMDDECPHRSASLAYGDVVPIKEFGVVFGHALVCPEHGWAFHVGNGKCDHTGYADQPVYPVQIVNNDVYVKVKIPDPAFVATASPGSIAISPSSCSASASSSPSTAASISPVAPLVSSSVSFPTSLWSPLLPSSSSSSYIVESVEMSHVAGERDSEHKKIRKNKAMRTHLRDQLLTRHTATGTVTSVSSVAS